MSAQSTSGADRSRPEQFRACIVIPFYNHPQTIGGVLASLKPLGLRCFVVDDASDESARAVVESLANSEAQWVTLIKHQTNQGKGGAVMSGCDAAVAAGYSHALQIDADGQHKAEDAPQLLEIARRHPHAVITGEPVYDQSVPRSRLYGRYVTHVWVWINTLSFMVRDSMCGFRVYPLAAITQLWRSHRLGRRMDFDIEVLVRAVWAGMRVVGVPTRVTYPADGISHFQALRDNVLISKMHARMFFGMLWRSPLILGRRLWWLATGRKFEAIA